MSDIIENSDVREMHDDRERTIVRTSMIGIGANLVLAGFKAAVGMAVHSVAVISDAVNNLSDALSSVITIVGAKLAGRAPDKKHPLGHGRIEYMSAFIVSALVLYAGITALVESVKKIIHPEKPEYSILSLVILATGVFVKLALGAYTKRKGAEVNSGSLTASGEDASMDAALSASVLVSALIFLFFHISLEAWVGAAIAIFIIRSGLDMISEAVDDMVGKRASGELTTAIRKTVNSFDGVYGAYDLFLNNYGPDKNIASVHIEVEDTMTAGEIDALTRKIQAAVYREHGVILSTVGIYAVNTGDTEASKIREDVRQRVLAHEGVLQFHGFYLEPEQKKMSFDVILDFEVDDRRALCEQIRQEISQAWPDYEVRAALDVDISD